jgi:hypothetical protein
MRAASLREKLLAALVDAAIAILVMAVVLGLGVGAAVAYAHRSAASEDEAQQDGDQEDEEDKEDEAALKPPHDGDGSDDQDDRPRGMRHRLGELLRSGALRPAFWGAGAGLAIANRNWRSPGFRVVGLRRVDARTGGPISLRSALIGVLFDQARQAATRPLFRSRAHRGRARMAELAPTVKEIEHRYAGDREARQRAVKEFYKVNDVKPFAGCGWQVAGPILSQVVLAATAIRDGQTVYDRLTGTIVVTDR